MSNATDILDALDRRWDEAEQGLPAAGDIVIEKSLGTGYAVFDWLESMIPRANDLIRIVERAEPEPKPRVVMASWIHDLDQREAYTLLPDGEWESLSYVIDADGLVDPVELVELPSQRELMEAMSDALGGPRGLAADIAAGAVLELLEDKR